MSSPAAWHPDPTRKHDHRWWDGTKWTEHVADAGESKIDHLSPGEAPTAPTGGVPPTAEPEPDITTGGSSAYGAADTGGHGGLASGGAAGATGAAGTTSAGSGADAGSGGLSDGGWEGTADPRQGQQWQQPGASDPHRTEPQPAWQQGSGQYQQGDPYGQQPAWDQGAQPYGQRTQSGTDGVAIAALVVGILSLLTSWFVLGGLGGVIALILGFVALGRIKRNRSGGRGMAITGIVTGVISILVAILVVIFAVGFFGDAAAEYEQCLQENSEEFCNEQLEQGILERFSN